MDLLVMMKNWLWALWPEIIRTCQVISERLLQVAMFGYRASVGRMYGMAESTYSTVDDVKKVAFRKCNNQVQTAKRLVESFVSALKVVAVQMSELLDGVKLHFAVIMVAHQIRAWFLSSSRSCFALLSAKVCKWSGFATGLAVNAVKALWYADIQVMVRAALRPSPLMSVDEDLSMPGGLFKIYKVRTCYRSLTLYLTGTS